MPVHVCENFSWTFEYPPLRELYKHVLCFRFCLFSPLFHNDFYEGAGRFPPWSPKTMWPGTHLDPLVLKISLMTMERGTDLSLSFFWPAQTFFRGEQTLSKSDLSPGCVQIVSQAVSTFVVSGTCVYQLGFGWRTKSSCREYTQLPHDPKMRESRYAQSTPSSPSRYFSTSGSIQEQEKFDFSSLVLSGRLFLCKLIGV